MGQDENPYTGEILFVKELERLKCITRTAWTSTGRQESTAEHSFRLALFLYVLKDHFPEVDCFRAVMMALVHDLGEAYDGDISAALSPCSEMKSKREEKGIARLVSSLPEDVQKKIIDLFLEYDAGLTPEARLVKALDKLETIIQHNQGKNPEDFDYGFNLLYGKEYTDKDPITRAIRKLIDAETKRKGGL